MDNFGDMLGGLGDIIGGIFGGGEAGGGGLDLGALLSRDDERRGESPPIAYERYLCGGPRKLNDR